MIAAVGMHRPARQVSRFVALSRVLAALAVTAAAWLVVVSHLTTALHFVLISHEICVTHGELVHGSSLAHPHASSRGPTSALPSGEQDSHEHCLVFGRRLEAAVMPDAAGLRLPPAPFAHMTMRSDDAGVVPSRAALLLTAPKQSPPA